jgi:serine/threonine protein kinase
VKSLDIKQIIKFALQFCYGMEHAVTHGIVCHRDIKPGNCLITEDITLKITDFGLAKASDHHFHLTYQVSTKNKNHIDLSKTKTGEVGGTSFYMAPEQFEDIKHLDIRSDIYSFGVMLYEMISGKLPFYGNTWGELRENHKKEEIPDISTYLSKQEKPLLDIVYKCMAKKLKDRYVDFSDAIKEFTKIYKLLYIENPPLTKKEEELNIYDLNNKGISLANLKHYIEAIECYDKAIKIDPKDLSAWYNKGVVLGELNRNQEGVECHKKVLEIDQKDIDAWYNKGVALGNLNRNQEAVECYNKALEIDSKDSNTWYTKGIILVNLGYLSQSLESLKKAKELGHPKAEEVITIMHSHINNT